MAWVPSLEGFSIVAWLKRHRQHSPQGDEEPLLSIPLAKLLQNQGSPSFVKSSSGRQGSKALLVQIQRPNFAEGGESIISHDITRKKNCKTHNLLKSYLHIEAPWAILGKDVLPADILGNNVKRQCQTPKSGGNIGWECWVAMSGGRHCVAVLYGVGLRGRAGASSGDSRQGGWAETSSNDVR